MILFAALMVIAAAAVVCYLAGIAGDGSEARRRNLLRRRTPYRSVPTPVDDGGYDEWGRPW